MLTVRHLRFIQGRLARLASARTRIAPRRYWHIPDPFGLPLPRRSLLRGAAGGAVVAGAVLAGCSRTSGSTVAATPTGAKHRIHLFMLADTDSLVKSRTVQRLLQEAVNPFLRANPDLDVKVGFMQGNSVIPSIIAGTGPDVISDWYAAPYWEQNLLLKLDPFLKQDNISTSVWSKGQWDVMNRPFGVFMLPAYFSPMVYAVNLSLFDRAGLSYPDPNWTHREFARVCTDLTVHSAKLNRVGAGFGFHAGTIGGESWVFQAFGGSQMNSAGTQSTLSSHGSVAAGTWMYETLFWPKICTSRNRAGATYGPYSFLSGRSAMAVIWDGIVLNLAAAVRSSFKWRIYPNPIFPSGRFTQGTEDFYGINAQTKHPQESWRLLKWLSYERTWQSTLMRIGAVPPARNDLWSEWISIVEQVAPPLRHSGLSWLRDGAVKGYAIPGAYYRYQDTAIRSIVAPWIQKLWNHSIDVPGAFAQADRQANALLNQPPPPPPPTAKQRIAARRQSRTRMENMFAQ